MEEVGKVIKNVGCIELSGRTQILKNREMEIINERVIDPAFERSLFIDLSDNPTKPIVVVDRLERSKFRLEVPGSEGVCELNRAGDLMGCKFSKVEL